MGRLINYDSFVQEKLNEICKDKQAKSGLIIGQCSEQKDIAVHLCPTPIKEDEQELEEGVETNKTKNKDNLDCSKFDEQWICQHAKQLLRALPGGLDILGLYVVAPVDSNTKYQAHMRQILFAIYKTLSKSRKLNLISKERVLLNICPVSTKITCRTFNIADFKSSANPAEWKAQSGLMRWQRLRCQIAVDIRFPIKSEDSSLSLLKQIEMGLRPFLDSVLEAHAIVDGKQRDHDELLDMSSEGKKSKRKQLSVKEDNTSEWHDVELFIPLENKKDSSLEVFNSSCMMTFKGAVQCRAYVHGKATVNEAINALKQDILRSVISRCEIHCEDLLLIEEEQKDPLVVHELPRRVFAPLPQNDLCVCDYQFHSDTAADSLDAFKELLNLDLLEQDIDTSCEKSPTTSTLILPEVVEDRLSEFGDAPPSQSSSMNIFIPAVGVGVAVLFMMASYFVSSQSS